MGLWIGAAGITGQMTRAQRAESFGLNVHGGNSLVVLTIKLAHRPEQSIIATDRLG